jgi:L-lactate dehydrogenase (cytochrome)
VLIDSGVRTGQDIFRALALGANACMIGRAALYGLGAGGEAGVARAIDIFRGELDTTMILAGIDDVKKIDLSCGCVFLINRCMTVPRFTARGGT